MKKDPQKKIQRKKVREDKVKFWKMTILLAELF